MVVGSWQLVVGSWKLAVGRWPLAVGCWQLAVGRWQLVVGRWQLAVGSCRPGVQVVMYTIVVLLVRQFSPLLVTTRLDGSAGTRVAKGRQVTLNGRQVVLNGRLVASDYVK